ncbi:hypothetical protein IAQ61_008160 [Plenodomus lingam]|uniref:uncharacterized protein n=1 Tax=Leptosphaeria maculans TaxID=5022 RepID=UPI00333245D3|nr:hypothetical protein IAQ61_008160 [Plenodomus lingam]
MALSTEAPDPREFKDWEDAFQYPIPVVRKLEQQLRNNADANREKLRSLVGASYRSLLDTAETIIDMEVRMDKVESKLARVGQSCNSRGLERISNNAGRMDVYSKSRDGERYAFASQLSVLRNAPLVMTRLMRTEGSYLLIAKVLVISRLVHKALTKSTDKPSIVDQLWERLLSVRRKLLRRIDKRLSSTTGETATLVESMCAYALATSSTPSDVLNHFHKVRLERMNSELLQGGDELAKHGINALKLCIQTCLDTQTIFPRHLAESLVKLKAHPLIQDPDVRSLYELNLDVHDRWIGDEARNYTPYPRHDELQRPQAEKMMHCWSKDAISHFLKGIKKALEGEERLTEVASLRSELIETWILSGSRMAGVKSTNVLDDLRDTMNEKLESIVRTRSQGLQSVAKKLTHQLENLQSHSATNASLWHTASQASDLSDGAKTFKATVLDTYHGRDEPVTSVTSAFDKWMESGLEVKGIVKSMKEARWDDTFADDVDDDSDDELGESKQTLLSDDDPKVLEEVTQGAMSDALQNLGQSFSKIVGAANTDNGDFIRKASFMLRVVREIDDRIPRLRLQERSTALASPFTTQIVQPLYMALAMYVVHPSIQSYEKSLAASVKIKTNSHILWEGQPPLPSQPSPTTFRFLRELNKSMAALGNDVWAPGCVLVLKEQVCKEVKKVFVQHVDTVMKLSSTEEVQTETNETEESKDGPDVGKTESKEPEVTLPCSSLSSSEKEAKEGRLKQLLFDALYLQRFTTTSEDGQDVAKLLSAAVDVATLDETALTRLGKYAADYAKKTYLLFALLA